jgi:hypothetical protein
MDGTKARFCSRFQGIFSHTAPCRLRHLWADTRCGRFFGPPELLGRDRAFLHLSSDRHHVGRRGHMARTALEHPNLRVLGEDGGLWLGVLLVRLLGAHLRGRAADDGTGEGRGCAAVNIAMWACVGIAARPDRCGACGSVSASPSVMMGKCNDRSPFYWPHDE